MAASVTSHTYSAGTRFYMVECRDCLVVLNSGHHYREADLVHAERLAATHNAEEHA